MFVRCHCYLQTVAMAQMNTTLDCTVSTDVCKMSHAILTVYQCIYITYILLYPVLQLDQLSLVKQTDVYIMRISDLGTSE